MPAKVKKKSEADEYVIAMASVGLTDLTLKCANYFSLPFGHKEGPLGSRQNKVLSYRNFHTKLSPYLYTCISKRTIIQLEKKNQNIYSFKMAAKTQISILRTRSRDQNLKNHFPKGIFQWNFGQSRKKREYVHCWNKIWTKLFRFKMEAKTFFVISPKKKANLC